MNISNNLVARLPFPPRVQQHLAQRADFKSALRRNEWLSEETWEMLWQKGLSIDEAKEMAGRLLTETQIDTVLATDSRAGTIGILLGYNQLTAAQLWEVINLFSSHGKPISGNVTKLLEVQENITPEMRFAIGENSKGSTRIEWLRQNAHDFEPARVADEMFTIKEWWGSDHANAAVRRTAIREICNEFPDVINALLAKAGPNPAETLHPTVVTVLAGCRHVRDEDTQFRLQGLPTLANPGSGWCPPSQWAAMAAAGNPVTSARLRTVLETCSVGEIARLATRRAKDAPIVVDYEDIDDPEVLDRLVYRSGGAYAASSHRPWDLLALARNPHLTDEQRDRIAHTLTAYGVMMVVGPDRAEAALALVTGDDDDVNTHVFDDLRRSLQYRDAPYHRPIEVPMWERKRSEADIAQIEQALKWRTSTSYEVGRVASAALFDAFGDDPARWEMFLGLAEHHVGTLAEAIDATLRLTT